MRELLKTSGKLGANRFDIRIGSKNFKFKSKISPAKFKQIKDLIENKMYKFKNSFSSNIPAEEIIMAICLEISEDYIDLSHESRKFKNKTKNFCSNVSQKLSVIKSEMEK